MRIKILRLAMLLPLAASIGGCAPRELFSWVDRNCFVADWTNHHSCVSCCCCKECNCRRPAPKVYEMVTLGNPPADDAAIK